MNNVNNSKPTSRKIDNKFVCYAVGMVAGFFDLLGDIKTRDRVINIVAYTGDTMNGFDLIADLQFSFNRS